MGNEKSVKPKGTMEKGSVSDKEKGERNKLNWKTEGDMKLKREMG